MGFETGFMGYRRDDGRVGVRNHVVVISSVSCANSVVDGIARSVPGVRAITHTEGCGRGPKDIPTAMRTLEGVINHPNVAGALVVGLGCEFLKPELLTPGATRAGRRVESIGIQELGGTPKTIARGVEIAEELVARAADDERVEVGFENLTLAMECGGSDALSGLTANPAVGVVADLIVEAGATVLLSEITEFLGAEDVVADRCATPEVREKLLTLLADHRDFVYDELGTMADLVIAPGNIEGGLSSIAEKSLGCVRKGGTTPIRGVVEYAVAPDANGLVVMDTPGSDIFSITGMTAAGAQIVLFTTGRGSPAGSPIAPVVKIASNSELFEWMNDDIDFDAGRIAAGESLDTVGGDLAGLVAEVANGRPTKPELTRTELFAINTVGAAF